MPDVACLVCQLLKHTQLAIPQPIVLASGTECLASIAADEVGDAAKDDDASRDVAHHAEAKGLVERGAEYGSDCHAKSKEAVNDATEQTIRLFKVGGGKFALCGEHHLRHVRNDYGAEEYAKEYQPSNHRRQALLLKDGPDQKNAQAT